MTTISTGFMRRLRLALVFSGLLGTASLPADAQTRDVVRLRVVGGLAGVSQYLRHEEPFWTVELSGLTGGRYTADIVPFDRAGIAGQDMLMLIRLGVVPFGTALLGPVAAQYPGLAAPDLAGLSPSVRRSRATCANATARNSSPFTCTRRRCCSVAMRSVG